MLSTSEKGNAFRDLVAQVLRAAGFQAEAEIRVKYKNVDVDGLWTRDEVADPQRYVFEVKDFGGTLPLNECTEFANDYSPLINSDEVDHAWLISKGPISPSGRDAAQTGRGLKAMTFAQLQRRLLLLDPYLRDLTMAYEASHLADYYIRPETTEGEDLEQYVTNWIAAHDSAPLFILGPYGKGKSTFATHLAAAMANNALVDPTARAPLLVRLGEIADEQSLDGLLGKVLASQHRVQGYHFETVRELNRIGRFLVIYDGFDEMKHGLTPSKFQHVLGELMKLDEGNARILVLGRDTAFHDDSEFRAVIDGVQVTAAGRTVPTPGRRPYSHVQIRGFSVEEAREYVRRYLPIRAAEEHEGPATDPGWVALRIAELVSGRFDRLLERPVHAQMLCEVAVQPDQLRPNMSVYELFDSFVHYLLLRELEKRGRDRDFPIDIRRRFNASLAWWLWERGGASTTTLADIPQSLCEQATRDLRHSLGQEEMRRELIQGCLIEKGANTIYFHRSLQEFLAAEHLIETDLLQRTSAGGRWLETVTSAATPELIEFLVAGVNLSDDRRKRALDWLVALASAKGSQVSLAGFDIFVQLARSLQVAISDISGSPWLVWLAFLLRTGARDFSHRGRNTFPVLADLLVESRGASRETQAAALYALARALMHPAPLETTRVALALAACLPVAQLREAVEAARVRKSERQIIRYSDDFMLWTLLRSWNVLAANEPQDWVAVKVDARRLLNDSEGVLASGFDGEPLDPVEAIQVPVQTLYRAMSSMSPPVSERDIDAIRPFFNDPDIRRAITPVTVEHRSIAVSDASPSGPRERPTLSVRP